MNSGNKFNKRGNRGKRLGKTVISIENKRRNHKNKRYKNRGSVKKPIKNFEPDHSDNIAKKNDVRDIVMDAITYVITGFLCCCIGLGIGEVLKAIFW